MGLFSKAKPKTEAPVAKSAASENRANGAGGAPSPAPAASAPAPQAPAAQPSAQSLAAMAQRNRRAIGVLGEIVSVLMRSPQHRAMSLADAHTMIAPALTSSQYLIAAAQDPTRTVATPVAVALWAQVSAEIDQRLSANPAEPVRLEPADWTSGDIPWLILVAGDQRAIQPMLAELQKTKLGGKAMKMRARTPDGAASIRAWDAATQKALEPIN